MSAGLTPAEFVQQVYYQQEKVLLDFKPNDDKYREVIMEGNFVLQELQKEEDWSWLRERLVLGTTGPQPGESIPEYQLPDWVYKVSTLHDDTLHLYYYQRGGNGDIRLIERGRIDVPWGSAGEVNRRHRQQHDGFGRIDTRDRMLHAVQIGSVVTFNRPLCGTELTRVAVCDVQRRFELMHVMDKDGRLDENGLDPDAEERYFTEIPDPNYMVYRTAALHAAGSPPAQARIQDLTDTARTLLSAMRQNDASATEPDTVDWGEPFGQVVIF